MSKGLKLTFKLILAQAVTGIIAAVVVYSVFGLENAVSILTGTTIAVLGSLVLGLRMFYPQRVSAADIVLARFLRGELQRFLITVVLLVVAIKWLGMLPLPLFAAFFLTVIVNWASLPFIKH